MSIGIATRPDALRASRTAPPLSSRGVFLLFALPFAALTIVFGLWPILLSLQVSLTSSATALKPSATYVGLANYAAVLGDPVFRGSLLRTLAYTGMAVIACVGFSLAYAMLLDHPVLGHWRIAFKVAAFLPVVTPDVAGYVVWRWLYDGSFGAVNAILGVLHLPAFPGLASAGTVTFAVLVAELWHHAGFYIVIFLANLALCDRALSEAAALDGASRPRLLWHVSLPQLRPALLINGVYALIQFLKTFTVVVVMTKGGPNDATNFVSYYAYQLFDQGRYGEATAMATILFAIVLVIALAAYRLGQGRTA